MQIHNIHSHTEIVTAAGISCS